MPLLQICDLSVSFVSTQAHHAPVHALRHCSLQVETGQMVGLIGESGCGKTTLNHVLEGMLPYSHGQVLLNGHELRSLLPHQSKGSASATSPKATTTPRKISSLLPQWLRVQTPQMQQQQLQQSTSSAHIDLAQAKSYYALVQSIPQDPRAASAGCTLERLALAPLLNFKHYSTKQAREVIVQELAAMELPADMLSRAPTEVSNGQLQRLFVLKSLAIKPQLLLCDEITSALDPHSAQLCLERLRQEVTSSSLSVLYITHDLGLALQYCDVIYVMFKGTVVERFVPQTRLRYKQYQSTEATATSAASAKAQASATSVATLAAPAPVVHHPYTQQLRQAQLTMARKMSLEQWQAPQALSCPRSNDELCPFVLRCSLCTEVCLQQKPQCHKLSAEQMVFCHLPPEQLAAATTALEQSVPHPDATADAKTAK